jgi:hypothetical protein
MGKIPPGELSNHYTMGKILQEEDLAHGVMVRLLPWRILPME